MSPSDETACPGCGGLFPTVEGPVHRYLESSPGCWRAYGLVLAREYSDPAHGALHRLTVDSYAVQHPGHPSRQSIQSVALHLMALCLVLERGQSPEHVSRALAHLAHHDDRYTWLTPPASMGEVTVADLVPATSPAEHLRRVRAWAESAWRAWAQHHDTVRAWLPRESTFRPKSR